MIYVYCECMYTGIFRQHVARSVSVVFVLLSFAASTTSYCYQVAVVFQGGSYQRWLAVLVLLSKHQEHIHKRKVELAHNRKLIA